MNDIIRLDRIVITVIRKDVKHVHLTVHPPDGRVTLVAPKGTRLDVARAYAATKISWIRKQREAFKGQAREPKRKYIERESHYLWGRRYLLSVIEQDRAPYVSLDHRRITLCVRPGSPLEKRSEVIHEWHKALLHEAVPLLIKKWEKVLGVRVSSYNLQRMKTKWGSCNHNAGRIRINTELVKKPKDLLEYVVVHEMLHLIEPTHSEKFFALLNNHYPNWREARAELNELAV